MIQNENRNTVGCGDCGAPFNHDLKREGYLTCPVCGFEEDPCWFPDFDPQIDQGFMRELLNSTKSPSEISKGIWRPDLLEKISNVLAKSGGDVERSAVGMLDLLEYQERK